MGHAAGARDPDAEDSLKCVVSQPRLVARWASDRRWHAGWRCGALECADGGAASDVERSGQAAGPWWRISLRRLGRLVVARWSPDRLDALRRSRPAMGCRHGEKPGNSQDGYAGKHRLVVAEWATVRRHRRPGQGDPLEWRERSARQDVRGPRRRRLGLRANLVARWQHGGLVAPIWHRAALGRTDRQRACGAQRAPQRGLGAGVVAGWAAPGLGQRRWQRLSLGSNSTILIWLTFRY